MVSNTAVAEQDAIDGQYTDAAQLQHRAFAGMQGSSETEFTLALHSAARFARQLCQSRQLEEAAAQLEQLLVPPCNTWEAQQGAELNAGTTDQNDAGLEQANAQQQQQQCDEES